VNAAEENMIRGISPHHEVQKKDGGQGSIGFAALTPSPLRFGSNHLPHRSGGFGSGSNPALP